MISDHHFSYSNPYPCAAHASQLTFFEIGYAGKTDHARDKIPAKIVRELTRLLKDKGPLDKDRVLLLFRLYHPKLKAIHKALLPAYAFKGSSAASYSRLCADLDKYFLWCLKKVTVATATVYIDKIQFFQLIRRLRAFARKLDETGSLKHEDLGSLNALRLDMLLPVNPVTEALAGMYESLIAEVIATRSAVQCGVCGRFLPYRSRKKYCSLAAEGRDCGKKARRKKH